MRLAAADPPRRLQLFKKDEEEINDTATNSIKKARALLPDDLSINDINCSGKLLVLADILSEVRNTTDEKVVIVSNFTKVRNFSRFHLWYRIDWS